MKRIPHLRIAAIAVAASALTCSSGSEAPPALATFNVQVLSVNGKPLPSESSPLPANNGSSTDQWAFHIEAVGPDGTKQPFNGYVRLRVEPGTVVGLQGTPGRNVLLTNGVADGVAELIAVYGPARLWVEDLGYLPAKPGTIPKCSDGLDNNDNGLIDFPSDPGCYYADDDSEDGGTYAAGVSQAIQYQLPKISDVRGPDGARTPWPNESVSVSSSAPEQLIVTRIASNGFFVTDVNAAQMASGKNSLFSYNFSAPPNMAVCDQITSLSGTANDFYGFTQLGFPTWSNYHVSTKAAPTPLGSCLVPEPIDIASGLLSTSKTVTAKNLYPYEASLVRLHGYALPKNLGAGLALYNNFKPDATNCDFNGNGQIDYGEIAPNCPPGMCEGDCSTTCDMNPDCSEWTEFSARNEVKVHFPGTNGMIKINAATVSTFDVRANRGQTLDFVTGTLTEFSGGNLNWTVEVRCQDDLACPASMGCTTQGNACTADKDCTGTAKCGADKFCHIPVTTACVAPPTMYDNDEGTN